MVQRNISAGVAAIKENIMVIRAKFRPLLDTGQYLEDVSPLVKAVPRMLDNVDAMASELENAFDILMSAPKAE